MATGRTRVIPFPSGLFGEISYLVLDGHGAAFLVDPGYGVIDALEAVLAQERCRLEFIALTHEHHDHIGSLNEIRTRWEIPVMASEVCSQRMMNPKTNLSAFHHPGGFPVDAADVLVGSHAGSHAWRGLAVGFHPTPGHTPGSICISVENRLFSGDTLILDTPTIVNLPGGSREDLTHSLAFLFSRFDGNTIVHPGHGPSFRLADSSPESHLRKRVPDWKVS